MAAKRKTAKAKGPLVDLSTVAEPLVGFRPYQEEGFLSTERLLWYIMRRQAGKTHMLGNIGLDWMMEEPGADVLFVSASLRLGIENIRKEAEVFRKVMETLRKRSAEAGLLYATSADDDNGNLLDIDAIADLFEHQKLETKLWHSNSVFSRSLVVAPNPDTAVGWTSHLILDEVGRMPEFKALFEAVEPIVSSSRTLKVRGATTPPPDDSHYSYELLCPKSDAEFPVNPRGNYYESAAEHLVLRVDAWDAQAAGVPMFSLRTGKVVSPEESRKASADKTAWDRNYGCKFVRGGSAALSTIWLTTAQAAGAGRCMGVDVTEAMQLKEVA